MAQNIVANALAVPPIASGNKSQYKAVREARGVKPKAKAKGKSAQAKGKSAQAR